MDKIINLSEKLGGVSEIIRNFRNCYLVCTGFDFSQDKVYYLMSDFLYVREIARCNNNVIIWSMKPESIKEIYSLDDEEFDELEFEIELLSKKNKYENHS